MNRFIGLSDAQAEALSRKHVSIFDRHLKTGSGKTILEVKRPGESHYTPAVNAVPGLSE